YILPDTWSIIEKGFDSTKVKSSESLFSLGNGAMGQRANFEEKYSGETFQGSYIAGVYYPDKTRVGWWKNGYPEYFAKVLNAPNWIGIQVFINNEELDLNTCKEVKDFRRELNMQQGWLSRSFTAVLSNNVHIQVKTKRFLSLDIEELGAIKYEITPLSGDAVIRFAPYLDAGITNEDTNWDDIFWNTTKVAHENQQAFIEAHTMKTHFHTCTFMQSKVFLDENELVISPKTSATQNKIVFEYEIKVRKNQSCTLHKFGGYTVDRNYEATRLIDAAKTVLQKGTTLGFNALLEKQKLAWEKIWNMSDITIEGDVEAQQGIRFNIFQLNQTYLGKDARLNIGPKGFTGEKYGGSTYWDTEAYCIPFYMATKDQQVARNLLTYRYNHLGKAIENAEKLGFCNGAALYPMVTMNGEESHNEWEITFEEIHRNGAIAYAIFDYIRYTGDEQYLTEYGLEVLIAIARFWAQRINWSSHRNKYVMLGVTGPNEYENNVNNNWYTNTIAVWTLKYAQHAIDFVKKDNATRFQEISKKTSFSEGSEVAKWKEIVEKMYFPEAKERGIFLQQ